MRAYAVPTIEEISLRDLTEERPVALITHAAAWAAAAHAGLHLAPRWRAEPTDAAEAHFAALAEQCPGDVEVVYGVGGGLAADAAKYVAAQRKLPLIFIPTALSVDAHLTWASGVRRDGCVAYLETGPAQVLYADYALLAAAPPSIRAAGICDLLSIATGLFDWRYAEERGQNPPEQSYLPWAANMAQQILNAAIDIAPAAGRGDPGGLRDLLRLLALEVQLCNLLGHSRPEEGSEHYLAYALEAHPSIGAGHAHGDLVGPAILRAAQWQRLRVEPLRRALIAACVPLDRVPPDALAAVERDLPAYVRRHNLPYGIAHDLK
jgi:glycerol-1-phosphate dehydrogenase [NAD(P)+]